MTADSDGDATMILRRLSEGDTAAAEQLMPLVYQELRGLAGGYLRRERVDHTLQPTALVHEAFLKLVHQDHAQLNDRAHFLAVAAEAMRRILVDHSRKKSAAKRQGGERVTLAAVEEADAEQDLDLAALDDALNKLVKISPRQARIVELRYFGGMTVEEVAITVGISPRTVKGDWRVARAWLQRELAVS